MLDPVLGGITETANLGQRANNWAIIVREFKKFGVVILPKEKDLLIEGDNNAFRSLFRVLKKCDKAAKEESFQQIVQVKVSTKAELELIKSLEASQASGDEEQAQQEGADQRHTIDGKLNHLRVIKKKKRKKKSSKSRNASLEPPPIQHKPRELFTDLLIKTMKNLPPLGQYNPVDTQHIPNGQIAKANEGDFFTEAQYKSQKLPGPAHYSPKVSAILKRDVSAKVQEGGIQV
ncbi:hypothetical protein FGO68_gene4461 [Halteria grandinella]|uniref:Uncharacterized protein n=1 Tax=Halteria grandinella TaxID=5974 RepID=A0A8J8NDB3_HALGN|nr:hypothetical protein FGO68_gene4461 [Halteria grandinella]